MRKLNKSYIIIFVLATLLSCSFSSKNNPNHESQIIGTWVLNKKQVNYPKLTFKSNSTCIFTSMGDTLYKFKYRVTGSELILEDVLGRIEKNKILELSKDVLIFENLWKNKGRQEYNRKEN